MLALVVVGVVMERNRTPVDYVEGESELVAGLATEMGGLRFRLLFLMEYGVMRFYAMLLCYAVVGVGCTRGVLVGAGALGIVSGFAVLRLTLPRRRYDLSMEWGWKVGLIVVFLLYLVGVVGIVLSCSDVLKEDLLMLNFGARVVPKLR